MGDFSGGGSDKSTSNSTTTTSVDRRQVVSDSGIGVTSDSSTINITTVDSGLVSKALDTVSAGDATNGQGFTQLLSLADKLFTGAGTMVAATQQSALNQVEALNTVVNDSKGKIDQKTMIMLAGAAAVVLVGMKK